RAGIKAVTGALTGAGFGAAEYVDEGQTRAKNTLYGALFGAGGELVGEGMKKMGAKAWNAAKGKMKNADYQEMLDLFKKYGIEPTESMITGKDAMTEKALERIPILGTAGHMQKGAEQTKTAIKKKAEGIGDDWSGEIQASLQRKAKTGRANAKANYGKVKELAGDLTVSPDNAISIAKKQESELSRGVLGKDVSQFTTIIKKLKESEKSFEDLRMIRSELGKEVSLAYKNGNDDLGRRLKEIRLGVEYDIDDLVKGKVKGPVNPIWEDVQARNKALDPGEQYNTAMESMQETLDYDNWNDRLGGFGDYRPTIQKMANFVKMSGHKKNKNGELISEHIPVDYFGQSSDEIADAVGMSESEFMGMLADMPKKPEPLIGKSTKNLGTSGLTDVEKKNAVPPKEGVIEAYKHAQSQYKKEVVPYKNKNIKADLETLTPDEIFKKYMGSDSKDKAANFYKLLDKKGQKALRDGFLSKAIKKSSSELSESKDVYNSPAKIAGYIERMAKPGSSVFKGKDLEELNDFAKVMRHAARYGQLNEAPSTGFGTIPLKLITAMGLTGYGAGVNPKATAIGVGVGGVLTKLSALMKTKGFKFKLASDKIGSQEFEDGLQELLDILPKAAAIGGKETRE
ncbi:MAG TPA: hypothetical protein VMW29_00445, partial [Candidatus Bathyarchaeia archaeon]|nr:hypothetical protein [Candidatus Bathyarchaeia archaeon]